MTSHLTHAEIQSVRDASRRMVRNLGFMRPTLAETDLSPSSVHAIIEIGRQGAMTARRLGQILLLEKSSVSRLLARLVERGLVEESASETDGRVKSLSLTPDGHALLGSIDHFANLQVGRALHALSSGARASVVEGIGNYAAALQAVHGAKAEDTAPVDIVDGFLPGAIGRIAEMHGRYYARDWNFPPVFEAKVAGGLSEFVPRLENPANGLWLAVQGGEIKGSVAVDGEDLGDGKAHLRWVIVDDELRGSGTGRRLLEKAVAFCDARGFAEIHLWTFSGLHAARKLYESVGFVLVDEWDGEQWGFRLPEQKFVRKAPAAG